MTFVRVNNSILYLEQEQKDPFIYPEKINESPCEKFKFTYHLNNYQSGWFCYLKGRKVDDQEAKRIKNKMIYVMTGKEVVSAHEAMSENGKRNANKRKSKGWDKHKKRPKTDSSALNE